MRTELTSWTTLCL